jgi:hypothetical protein
VDWNFYSFVSSQGVDSLFTMRLGVDEEQRIEGYGHNLIRCPCEDLPCSLATQNFSWYLVDSNDDDDENLLLDILTHKNWNHETNS